MKNIILTKDELILAFRQWVINSKNEPTAFQNQTGSLEDATISAEYFLELIDKMRAKS